MPDRLFHYTTREFALECAADMETGRPVLVEVWDGVLVLDPNLADVPFTPVDGHIWLMGASWGLRAPVEGMIVAVGAWESGEWRVDEYE